MKRLIPYLPLLLLVTGCGAMQWLGLSDAAGEATPAAVATSAAVRGLTGIDILGLWKMGEALLTKRGRGNLRNVFSPKTGAKSTAQSVLSLLVGEHSPVEAKAEATP